MAAGILLLLLLLSLAYDAPPTVESHVAHEDGIAQNTPPKPSAPAAAAAAASSMLSRRRDEFEAWMALHNKSYGSHDEYARRLRVFAANSARIDAHNHNHSHSHSGKPFLSGYSMAHNRFSDLTHEEFRATMTEERHSHGPRSTRMSSHSNGTTGSYHRTRNTTRVPALPVGSGHVPASVDWRNASAVTAVKDQGQCGSCWAFSATGAMEGAHALAGRPLVSLSEQQLIDCEESNLGCHGGLQPNAFVYAIDNDGIEAEAAYPYVQDKQPDTKHRCVAKASASKATFSDYHELEEGDEQGLLQAVGLAGPVSIDMDAGGDPNFQFYSGGVFASRSCTTITDHAVLAIGYGVSRKDESELISGVVRDGDLKYWLVKNSWGTSWGIGGYFMIERGVNMCGVAQYSSYPIV